MSSPNAFLAAFIVAPIVAILGCLAIVSASPYSVPEAPSVLDGSAASRFETHFDEQFPLRALGRNFWYALRYAAFGEGMDGLVVGHDGWFYTEQEFRPYPGADDRLTRHLRWIITVKRHLEARQVELAVALLPAKARIYAEHSGDRAPAGRHPELYAHARRRLTAAGLNVVDLESTLRACKREQQVFLKTDTHWTPAGAACAAEAVAGEPDFRRALSGAAKQNFVTRRVGTETRRGDLMTYLPLAPFFAQLMPEPETVPRIETRPAGATTRKASLFGDTAGAPVALVGTSYSADELWHFGGALEAMADVEVVNLAEAGDGPFAPMARLLSSDELTRLDPKLVVWEIPERYLVQPDNTTRTGPSAKPRNSSQTEVST